MPPDHVIVPNELLLAHGAFPTLRFWGKETNTWEPTRHSVGYCFKPDDLKGMTYCAHQDIVARLTLL